MVDGTQIGNVEPTYDDCPSDPVNIHFDNKNIGDLLDEHHVSWGWFSDGFKPTSRLADGTPVCDETRTSKFGVTDTVYDSGNSSFQYYKSTSNQLHLPPASVAAIGNQDQANHEYDTTDFWAAARAGNLPAVSINRLERLPSWRSTAVVIMYDDSDGGYEHVMPPIVTVGAGQPRRQHPYRPDLYHPLHRGQLARRREARQRLLRRDLRAADGNVRLRRAGSPGAEAVP